MAKQDTIGFLKGKKDELKLNKYRQRFDSLYKEIDDNLVNTTIVKQRIDESLNKVYMIAQVRPDGSTDWATLPAVMPASDNSGKVPRSAEPIIFSKILVAASAISSRAPDGRTYSANKIKARAYYELLKRSWTVPEMNGYNTLDFTTQNLLTYGWAAWRQSPKQTIIDKTINGQKTKKIVFDDIFREPLDPRRTWLGLSYKPTVNDNRPEVLWEMDITKDAYKELKKRFGKRSSSTGDVAGVSDEAQAEDPTKSQTHVTITFYENPIENRYIVASGTDVFYDDEMPNDDCYGTILIAQCFSRDQNDPYGVGLYEMMRGNAYLYNYINSLNAEQVEAEVFPVLFASGMTGQGDMTFKRSPNVLNPLPNGAKIEKVTTNGNATLGMNYANAQKQNIEDNTGVNNIVAGSSSETTLGATVILKEAALNRLNKPRNSIMQAIENDACIFFSYLEQQQATPRKFIFNSPEEVKAFMTVNPGYEHHLDDLKFDDNGIPNSITVLTSERVPMSFDYSNPLLNESDFQNQNVNEMGDRNFVASKASIISDVRSLDAPDKIGYDHVVFKVDGNSMLIPSIEIQKQASAALFPLIQNSLTIIYGMAQGQDPVQAVAQLKSLETFMDMQKQNIYDYIPKDQFDAIMTQSMGPSQQHQMMMQQQAAEQAAQQAKQADQTQALPPEQAAPQGPMISAMHASVGRAAKPGAQQGRNK